MFDTQNTNQLHSPGTEVVASVTPCATFLLVRDPTRTVTVRAELGFFAAERDTGYDYRVHSHTAGETAEKARKAVTNRLGAAVAKIRDVHPALWQHQGPRKGQRKYRSGRAPPV